MQTKQNETCGAIAMVPLLAPFSFYQNWISPFSILSSATECLAQNRHASHMVSALLIRLLRVDGTWLTQKLRILILIKTGTAAKLLSWQQHHRVILFLSWCTFLEENCSNMSRDILDSVFYHFSCTVYYLITLLICIIQKR